MFLLRPTLRSVYAALQHLFTFQYVSIKTEIAKYAVKPLEYLHSNMFLLRPN